MTEAPAATAAETRKAGDEKPAASAGAAGDAPKPAPAHKARKRAKARITLPSLQQSSTRLRTVLLNLGFVAAFLVLVPVIVSQFWRGEVLIARISAPEALVNIGLSPDVVSSRLWDGIRDATARAKSSKQSLNAIPDSRRVVFSLPETGFSMDALIQQTRQFFNAYQTRVGGEFTCADPACDRNGVRLRIRVIRQHVDVIDMPPLGDTPLRDYFEQAAIRVLDVLDPYIAVAALAGTRPQAALVLANTLVRQRNADAKWAYNLIGMIKSTEGDTAGAIEAFRAALALDPNFVLARGNLANWLLDTGQVEEARAEFDRLAGVTDNPRILAARAELLIRDDQPDAADALLSGAARLDPRDPLMPTRRAEAALAKGDNETAEGFLRAALQLDPAFGPAMSQLGQLYLGRGDLEAADRVFGNFVEADPASVDAHLLRGATQRALGHAEQALAEFEAATVLDPANFTAVSQSAGALLDLGRTAEAKTRLSAAVLLDPNSADVQAALGDIAMGEGDYAGALIRFEGAAALDPQNATYLYDTSNTLAALQRYPEAIGRLERLLTVAPERVEAWFAIGNYHRILGQNAEAVAAYRKFLELAPAHFAEARAMAEDGIRELSPAGSAEAQP